MLLLNPCKILVDNEINKFAAQNSAMSTIVLTICTKYVLILKKDGLCMVQKYLSPLLKQSTPLMCGIT